MYDLWVDAGEEAYAAAAHGSEFAKAQAELNDALMDLKAEQRAQVETGRAPWTCRRGPK